MRRSFAFGIAALLGPAALLPSVALSDDGRRSDGGRTEVIVVLKDSVPSAGAVATEHGRRGEVQGDDVYESALKGFSASVTPAGLAELNADPRVAFVEPDGPVTAFTTQSGATWGLDRIDQRLLPLGRTFTYNTTGAGVTAYVIDTGVMKTHTEFGGRVSDGIDVIDGGEAQDCNGHGTHVAGTVGGSTYGVAKGVNIVAVRVLDCNGSGTISGVIAGVNWVTQHHTTGPAVANMSLGGGASAALDAAVQSSIADGVSYAVAAGNSTRDACTTSPARVANAMTVSASDSADRKPVWANYGSCVDWFAPGLSITSAWNTGTTATATISGTSMASPHTAGVAALYLQSNATASPAAVRSALFNASTQSRISSSRTTNNHLLFTNW